MTTMLVHNQTTGSVRAKPKKAERAPLKIAASVEGVQCHAGSPCSSVYGSLEEEFSQYEKLIRKMADLRRANQKCPAASVILACSLIKAIGPQAEATFKSELDQTFVEIRDAGRDSNIDEIARIHLLEIIELRANKWHQNENIAAYYRERIAGLKVDETDSPAVMTPLGYTGQLPLSQPITPVVSTAPILLPGEVIKNSGKFVAPAKIPGKNYLKDEVVIRNADSGKVMGIKGRRVHLIEEISETIISFQRVPAGAKERLVQITGPGEENIEKAKELISEVIRRNASPVRDESLGDQIRADSNSSINSVGMEEGSIVGKGKGRPDQFNEYRYTVSVGGSSVKLVGTDFEMVQTCKLVLDEYYKQLYGGDDTFSRSPSPYDDVIYSPAPKTPSPPVNTSAPTTPQLSDSVSSPRPVIMASDLPKLSPSATLGSILAQPLSLPPAPARQRRVYSRKFLLLCAESILSKREPINWDRITEENPDVIKTVINYFDGIDYLNIKDRMNYPEEGMNTDELSTETA